jgi:hypothetical protein
MDGWMRGKWGGFPSNRRVEARFGYSCAGEKEGDMLMLLNKVNPNGEMENVP